LLLVVGDADYISRFETAVEIWRQTSQIGAADKAFLLVRSDDHGWPQQIANHFFPDCDGYRDTAAVDARDFCVTFKLTVAALNCGFHGLDCASAFGHGSLEQVGMGSWSDGVPMKPMLNIDPLRDSSLLVLRPR